MPAGILLGLDFDGTLAPIVTDPELALPAPGVVELLSELSRSLVRLAIISGRDTDALAARLPVAGLTLVGNHGLEERNGESALLAVATPFAASLERAADAVGRLKEARIPGVRVERKRVGISVHFRNAPDRSEARASLQPVLQRIAEREQLRLHPGRMVWELRPPLEIDKGAVLRRLAAGLQPAAIIYIGDDLTDADAFSALKGMRDLKTLAVGVRSDEVPEAAFVDCDLTVDGITGVTDFLGELRDRCRSA